MLNRTTLPQILRNGCRLLWRAAAAGVVAGICSCATGPSRTTASREIVISVKDQKLALMEQGRPVAVYPVSTSKFCLGDTPGSYGTPLGKLKVAQKIGSDAPVGAVFKHREPTGEVILPNSPGRDPVVTRILRLTGQESRNARAYARNIYIHGTPEEATIGRPASFGCVRMRSQDVVDLYNRIPNGTEVNITKQRLPGTARALARHQEQGPSQPRLIHRVLPLLKPGISPPAPQLAATDTYGPPAP